jgi:hypothetical protein
LHQLIINNYLSHYINRKILILLAYSCIMLATRSLYLFLSLATVVIALVIRKSWAHLPYWINFWIWDFLWAFMLYWLMFALFLPARRWFATCWLIVFCWLIEWSQTWHTDWLDSFRHSHIGGLLLGHGFLWSDIIAYTFGALAGFAVHHYFISTYKKFKLF